MKDWLGMKPEDFDRELSLQPSLLDLIEPEVVEDAYGTGDLLAELDGNNLLPREGDAL